MRKLLLIAALLGSTAANATDYYLDPVNGLDTNAGTSQATAWKTEARINTGTMFFGGDKIHIAGGSTLHCAGINSPVTGTGICIYIRGADNFDNLPTNFTPQGGLPVTIDGNFNPQNGPYTVDLSGGGLKLGVAFDNADGAIAGGIVKGGATQLNFGYQASAGIFFGRNNNGSVSAHVTGMEVVDFSVLIWAAQAFPGTFHASGHFTNNYLHGSTPSTTVGEGILMQGWENSSIEGNFIENIGAYPTAGGSGILISNAATNVLDQYNLVRNGGVNNPNCGNAYGNWVYNSTFITIQYNEVSGQKRAGGCDGGGMGLDGGTANSVVQYNYSHDNAGPGFYIWQGSTNDRPWGPNTIQYNLSVHDALGDPTGSGDGTEGGITFYQGDASAKPAYIQHNTVVNTAPSGGRRSAALSVFTCPAPGSVVANNLLISSADIYGNAELVFGGARDVCPGVTWTSNSYEALSGTPQWYQASWQTSFNTLAQWQAAIFGGDAGAAMSDGNLVGAGGACYRGVYGVCR